MGVTYEIFVQSFCDSTGDGIGDLNGVTSKLDYLQDLGVEAIWLMPIMPSPSYHKYNITNYRAIHPDYGTTDDFRTLVEKAHSLGIRVIIDFVINHTDKSHPWFEQSRRGKQITDQDGSTVDNPYRNYYLWKSREEIEAEGTMSAEVQADSDNVIKWYEGAAEADEWYFGYFGSHMPDLNYDNEEMKQKVFEIGQWWLSEMNVDGFRLDAAKHIFDGQPEKNHAFWVEFRRSMEAVKPNVYLVGEVWDRAEVVAPYLRGLPAAFNFDMGAWIIQAVKEGESVGLISKQKEITEIYQATVPDFIDATFLTNHDQERTLSSFDGDLDRAKLAASLLLTLPGSPYLYYGEEIGMLGRKPDEQIREPFLWNQEASDSSRAAWEPSIYSTDATVTPLALQLKDPESIYHHYRSLIHVSKECDALRFGEIDSLPMAMDHLLAFTRTVDHERVLVVHNLSGDFSSVVLPEELQGDLDILYASSKRIQIRDNTITLPAFGSVIVR